MHRLIETLGGLWELLRIGVQMHLGGGKRFWDWRRETAFGSAGMNVKTGTNTLSARDRLRAVLRFGAWVFRMKRMR